MGCALLFGLFVALASGKSYEGYKVLRTQVLNQEQASALQKSEDFYDFWKPVKSGFSTDVLVPPFLMKRMEQILKISNIEHSIYIENVEDLIKNERSRTSQGYTGKINFNEYYSHDDLNAYIGDVATQNPEFASVTSIGKSLEGRDMRVLHLEKAGPGKPNVWLEAGIHAREWISPAVATFLVRELVEDYVEHPEYLDNINWYFIPSANPDGYAYTFDTDRLWRKTRSPQAGGCYGVDPNRNWGFHWGESGVSSNPCTEIYPGVEPF